MSGGQRGSSMWRELERPQRGRLAAGVCAAIARALALDVSLVRLAFLILALASGLGVLLYLLLWLTLPAEGVARQDAGVLDVVRDNLRHLGDDLAAAGGTLRTAWERGDERPWPWPRPLSRRWIAIGLIACGSLVLLYSLGLFGWLGPGRLLGVLAIIAGAALLVRLAPERRH